MKLKKPQIILAGIITFFGLLVVGSYILGFGLHPNALDLWGRMPQTVQQLITTNMLIAASGFMVFSGFIVFRIDPILTRVISRLSYSVFHFLYLLVLIPSALWMPLALQALDTGSLVWVWTARAVLILVGLGSIGILTALMTIHPRHHRWLHIFSILGCLFFCLQTVVFDPIIWSIYFP